MSWAKKIKTTKKSPLSGATVLWEVSGGYGIDRTGTLSHLDGTVIKEGPLPHGHSLHKAHEYLVRVTGKSHPLG